MKYENDVKLSLYEYCQFYGAAIRLESLIYDLKKLANGDSSGTIIMKNDINDLVEKYEYKGAEEEEEECPFQ